MTLSSKSRQASLDNPPTGRAFIQVMPLILIILLGFGMRLFAWAHVPLIHSDGTLYIYQARALYYRQWSQLMSCGIQYLSIYPLFIAGTYAIVQNWIIAARSVSVMFGTLTLLPFYLLLRRFFESPISAMGTLIFALIPVFVTRSADALRDPIAWFSATFALYFFITHFDSQKWAHLFLSSLFYLIAAWARVEYILFVFISFFYILSFERERRLGKLIAFSGLGLILAVIGLSGLTVLGASIGNLYRMHEIISKISAPIISYKTLRANLAILINQLTLCPLQLLLKNVWHLIWFISLATVVVYIIRAFFYPFFFVFVIGLSGIRAKIKNDRRILYLLLLSVFALILLYLHTLQTWWIGARYFVLFMLPVLVFIGFGLENSIHFLKVRLKLSTKAALIVVCFLILAFGLAKNLKLTETDKVVFKNIGEFIAHKEGNNKVIQVASSLHILRWISFYANLGYQGAPCPQPYSDFKAIVGNSYKDFVQNLKKRRIKYFVWEEKHWPTRTFDFMREMRPKDFQALGTWSHPDTGRMILYRVR